MRHDGGRETGWLPAAGVAGGYLVALATLFSLQVASGVSLPALLALAMPPLVYAGLSVLAIPQGPLERRALWVGAACATHVLLGVLATVELALAGGLRATTALATAFVRYAPAPVLAVVATVFVLRFAWESLTAILTEPPAGEPTTRSSATPPAPAKPVMRTPPLRPRQAAGPATFVAPAPRSIASAPRQADAPIGASAAPEPGGSPPPPDPAPAPPPRASEQPATPRRGAASRRDGAAVGADEGIVRISFARVAAQLPAEAFVLPLDRLGDSLREPHTLLVPRRIVLAEMRDGSVSIGWKVVAGQFPELALRLSEDEFRDRYVDLRLSLPIDEVLAQLPDARRPLAAAVLSTEPVATPVPAGPPRGAGAFARARPAKPPTAAATTPAAMTRVAPETVARIVGCFEGLGTLEAGVEAVGATSLVALVEPGISRAAVAGCARALARFLAGDGDVATVRTAHTVVAVAVGPAATVVAGRRPGPSAALLELRVGAAATQLGAGVRSVPAPSRRALVPLAVDARVTGAGAALGSFGPVESAVFGDGRTRLYVFSARGRDAAVLGALALDVLEAVGNVTGELGRLVSVMFRRGPDRTLVRPLAGGATVLAVAGPVTRPGRIRADTDRAVAMLEAV